MSVNKLAKDRKKIAGSRQSRDMTGSYKQFDPAAYKQHNAPAIRAVLLYLESIGLYATENDDRYGPDIVVWKGFSPAYYIECAQRTGWQSDDWPNSWNPVRIEERKLHLFAHTLSYPCEYWIVSGDAKVSLTISEGIIRQCAAAGLVEVPNSRVAAGEKFICVPLDECNQLDLGE